MAFVSEVVPVIRGQFGHQVSGGFALLKGDFLLAFGLHKFFCVYFHF